MNTDERHIVVVAHNLRSCHNVGSLLRTAEGLGATKVILSGYTPHPLLPNDNRLPHEIVKITKQIDKTALGAAEMVNWEHTNDLAGILLTYREAGWLITAIEQAPNSTDLPSFKPPHKLIMIVGREVDGIEAEILALTDQILEIPMRGQKESFNVVQAAAIALYHCRFAI